jgi:hypothetical protein
MGLSLCASIPEGFNMAKNLMNIPLKALIHNAKLKSA